MLVYSENDYSFINRVDNIVGFDQLWRINDIKFSEVSTPKIGRNFSYYSDTKQESSGTPCGGGVIYLQKDYCAIAYDNNSPGFVIELSESFMPNEKWLKILPLYCYSTPMARMLQAVPRSLMFTPSGTLETYDDQDLFGAEADYYAVKNGKLLALFNVKDRTYPSLFYPYTHKETDLLALANFLKKNSDAGCYTRAKAVSGLMATETVKEETRRVRDTMRSYERVIVDYSKAVAFNVPVSIALGQNAVVNSALSKPNALMFLDDKEGDGAPTQDLIKGIVLSDCLIANAIAKDGFVPNLEAYLRSVKCNTSVIVLLDSEFQSILNEYHRVYNTKLAEVSYSTFLTIKGDLNTAINNVNSCLQKQLPECVKYYLTQKGFDAISNVLVGDIPCGVVQPVLSCPKPEPNGENSAAILRAVEGVINEYGHDSLIDVTGKPDLTKTSPINNLNAGDPSQSVLFKRALASYLETLGANLSQLDSSEGWTFDHNEVAVKKCRCCEINLLWGNGHGIKDDPKPSYHKALSSGKATIKPVKARFVDSLLEVDFKLQTTARYDQTCYDELSGALNTLYESAKNRITRFFKSFGTSFQKLDVHKGKHQWKCCSAYAVDVYSENKDFYVLFKAVVNLQVSKAQDLASVQKAISVLTGTPWELSCNPARGSEVAQKVSNVLTTLAARAAYSSCEYMFKSLKDAYSFTPIGMFGNDYGGVVCALRSLGRVCRIDEAYISQLTELIESIQDITVKQQLMPFLDELRNAKADWKAQKPIYYLDEQAVRAATPQTDVNAIAHYVLGAFEI